MDERGLWIMAIWSAALLLWLGLRLFYDGLRRPLRPHEIETFLAGLGATLVLPAWAALPIFGGLGLGLALPFLAIGFVPALRNRLPKPGPWMATFRKWMALPMGLTALALAWLLWRQGGVDTEKIGRAHV